jgi:hypothetical protein
MNRLVLVMQVKAGKTREAFAALKNLSDYLKSKSDIKAEMYMQIFGGTAGTIYVMADYKDLASAQAALLQNMADDKYMDLAQKLTEVIVNPPTVTLLQPI